MVLVLLEDSYLASFFGSMNAIYVCGAVCNGGSSCSTGDGKMRVWNQAERLVAPVLASLIG